MNDAEVKRLAHAINELRPSWPISSLTTFIGRNMANRPYRDAAVALVWVALDANGAGDYVTQTPKRVLEPGPWWKAAEMNGTAGQAVRRAPRRDEECVAHPGWHRENCGGCNADKLAGDEPLRRLPRADAAAGAALVRAELAKGSGA